MFSADVTASGVIVDSSVNLSLQLLRHLYDESSVNLVFSPYSIMAALMMVLLGTGGNSRLQLLQVLFGSAKENSVGQFISEYHQLNESNAKQLQMTNLGNAECYHPFIPLNRLNEHGLLLTNLLYPDTRITLKAEYVRQLKADFSARIKGVNFAEEASALQTINSDVKEATRGMIPQLLNQIKPSTVLILINTVYFNAKWAMPFSGDNTNEKGTFVKESGEKVKTPMMYAAFQIPYIEKSGVKAVLLPYSGSDISMVLLLSPKGKPMKTFLRDLESAFLDGILQELATSPEITFENRVNLGLPRFEVSSTHDALEKTLQKLGLTDIFSSKTANFSKLTDNRPIWVSKIIQKATIECTEEGTKAAAATAVEEGEGDTRYEPTPPPPPKRDFIADRPFVYALVRIPKKTAPKQILFMGVILDPSKAE